MNDWQRIPKIKLTKVADEIRIKNLGGQKMKATGPKKKMGELTYDDMAKLQQKIKRAMERQDDHGRTTP